MTIAIRRSTKATPPACGQHTGGRPIARTVRGSGSQIIAEVDVWINVADDKRVKGVLVRLTVAEHEEFVRLAEERRTTMAEMVRGAVLALRDEGRRR